MRKLADNTVCFSPSELKVSDQCLRQYYYKYIKKLYPVTDMSTGLLVGRVMHSAIEKLFLNDETVTPDYLGIIKDCIQDIKDEGRNRWTDATLPIPEAVFATRLVPLLHAITSNIDRSTILGVEEKLQTKLDNYHSLMGYLDIRYQGHDGKTKIADFKFGKVAKSENDILSFWYQFVGYKLMVESMFGEDADVAMLTGSISFAAKPRSPYTYKVIPVELNYKLFTQELKDRANALTEHIINGGGRENLIEHYPPTGRSGGICGYCDYLSTCSGMQTENQLMGLL